MPLMDLPPYLFPTLLTHLFAHSQVDLFGEVLLGCFHITPILLYCSRGDRGIILPTQSGVLA